MNSARPQKRGGFVPLEDPKNPIPEGEREELEKILQGGVSSRITFILTSRCNFNCKYCLGKSKEGEETDLETEAVHKAIHANNGRAIVRITGGEPALHPDFFRLLEYAARKGKVEVLTNGSWLPDNAEALRKKLAPLENSKHGNLLGNIQFQISADDEHFKHDPKLKERILSLTTYLLEKIPRPKEYNRIPWQGHLESNLKINVRQTDFKTVAKALSQGIRPEHKAAAEALKDYKFIHFSFEDNPDVHNLPFHNPLYGKSQSIIRVGSAGRYYGAKHSFDPYKDFKASHSRFLSDLVINPLGNAFASVYSAYQNNYDPQLRLGIIGNLYRHGIQKIAATLARRQKRFADYAEKYHKDRGQSGTEFFDSEFMDGLGRIRIPDRFRRFVRQRAREKVETRRRQL